MRRNKTRLQTLYRKGRAVRLSRLDAGEVFQDALSRQSKSIRIPKDAWNGPSSLTTGPTEKHRDEIHSPFQHHCRQSDHFHFPAAGYLKSVHVAYFASCFDVYPGPTGSGSCRGCSSLSPWRGIARTRHTAALSSAELASCGAFVASAG